MRGSPRRFTAAERAVIAAHRTPYQVQQYLNRLPYNHETHGETLRTFRGVVRHGTAHCLEAALSAALILEQHGYPVQFLDLESWDDLDHVLFLYRHKGRWGTVARSRDPGLHGRKPVFETLEELVDSYFDPFIDFTGRITGYGVGDLAAVDCDWRLGEGNVWEVQDYFIDLPHRPFHRSNERYRFWHQRFRAYKRRYPDRRPTYFDNKRCWTAGYPRGV